MPVIEVEPIPTPAVYNDLALTQQAAEVLTARFGDAVDTASPVTGGEDFARYGLTEDDVPIFMFWVGGAPHDVWAEYNEYGMTPPANHSPFFYPEPEQTIVTATEGMVAIALDLFENGVSEGAAP